MAKTGRTIGRFLRKMVTSQWWSGFRNASREISQLPITLMREASIEEAARELNDINNAIGDNLTANSPKNIQNDFSSWILPQRSLGNTHNYTDSDDTSV